MLKKTPNTNYELVMFWWKKAHRWCWREAYLFPDVERTFKYPYNAFRVNQKIQTLRWRLNLHSGYVPHVSKIHVLNILRAFLSDTATTIWFSLIRKMKIFLYFDVNMYSFGFYCRTCLNIGAPWIHLILALQNRQRCNYV